MTNNIPFEGESVLKPLSDVQRTIEATSAGDMLLFMIAMGRKEKADQAQGLTEPKTSVN